MYLLIDLHSYFVRSCQKETGMNMRDIFESATTHYIDRCRKSQVALFVKLFYDGFNDRGDLLCVKGESFHLFP
jgi:hypothetical protein